MIGTSDLDIIAVTEDGCDVLSPEIGTLYELDF